MHAGGGPPCGPAAAEEWRLQRAPRRRGLFRPPFLPCSLIWTDALHRRFLEALEAIGGVDRAPPKAIMKVNACPLRGDLAVGAEATSESGAVCLAFLWMLAGFGRPLPAPWPLQEMGVTGLTRENVASHLQVRTGVGRAGAPTTPFPWAWLALSSLPPLHLPLIVARGPCPQKYRMRLRRGEEVEGQGVNSPLQGSWYECALTPHAAAEAVDGAAREAGES